MKYHCIDGIQFYWFGLSNNIKEIWLEEFNTLKLETNCTVVLPLTKYSLTYILIGFEVVRSLEEPSG